MTLYSYHPYRILIIGGATSGKNNVLLNLIKHQQPDIKKFIYTSKMHLNLKYQLFINGREKVGIKTLKIPKAFIDYSQTINHLYENLEDYNPARKGRVLIVFDDMIADMESNEKLSPIVTEMFL